MKGQRLFIWLSLFLFVVLAVIVLFVTQAATTSYADAVRSPLRLAPPMPTPTPMPWPEGAARPSRPSKEDVDALALRPDLVIQSIQVVPAHPFVFNQATVKVTIANIGLGWVAWDNNFHVDFYLGDAGVPGKGERGITCPSGSCHSPSGGYSIYQVLPWGCQGFWVAAPGAPGSTYVLTATVVFSDVKSYYLYAQIDTPEKGYSWGYVLESNEDNNIYPTNSSVTVQTKAPYRFTQSTHVDFHNNYASSLEVIPESLMITDINGVGISVTSKLTLGRFEEPPVDWGTTVVPPNFTSADYNVLSPDAQLNTVTTRDQNHPIIASDGISLSHNLVAVWQDHRNSTANPDVYLRWASDEADVGGGHFRPNWQGEQRVNDDADPTAADQRNPAVAVAPNGDVVVVWQDNRENIATDPTNYDIYLQQYRFIAGVLTAVGTNQRVQTTVCPTANEAKPDIAVDKDNNFYVVWQSQCTEQSAIWGTKGVIGSWDPGRYVADPNGHDRLDPRIDVEATKVISITNVDVSDPLNPIVYFVLVDKTIIVVTWHEDRGLGTGDDIYVTYNDTNFTSPFAVDQRVNDDTSTLSFKNKQDQPVATVTQDKISTTIVAYGVEIELNNIPVPALHVAWRDFRNSTGTDPDPNFPGNDPDIYYAHCPFMPTYYPPYLAALTIGANQKLNSNDTGGWQTGPPKQFDPDIAGHSYADLWNTARQIPYDVYVVWSDGRNYDNRNYDIYMWLFGYNFPEGLTRYNINLNDEAKIHNFDSVYYDTYSPDRPPAAKQVQPSVSVSLEHDEAVVNGGYVYLAWADDRLSSGNAADDSFHETFFARSNLTFFGNYDIQDYGASCSVSLYGKGAGAYISKAFDSCPTVPLGSPCDDDTTWYKLDYGAATPSGGWVALQTRVADNLTDLLNAEWWPQNLVWEPGGACLVPTRGYLGPGSYIEQSGSVWPKGRYAQYRVNFWSMLSDRTPELYYVTLFYGGASQAGTYGNVYLPIVVRRH